MTQTAIFIPVFVLVLLSYAIWVLMLKQRIQAVKEGLNPGYFLYNRGAKPPEFLIKVEQHYENLFELPVLFYIVCISLYATAHVDRLNLALAWAFVLSRFAHAYIHIGKNRLLRRRNIFLLSSVILLGMWVEFALGLEFFTRPHRQTPEIGLWPASAFASPGGGFASVILAGEEAVRALGRG